jgi:oligosaccharyltransferase complex subunit alpha (ribophorin I)
MEVWFLSIYLLIFFQYSELKIHFANNFPFAKFSSLIREIEVSHWGNIAIEEIYELKHVGARLKGGFSRFDYQMKRGAQSPSFRSLTGYLPHQASNIYYRDQIGNISTSDIRVDTDGKLELEVQTRFPIFGGWQTQFYIGYSIPTELALFRDSTQRYTLKIDFFTIFKDVWIEDLDVKIILPEGCSNVLVDVPYPVDQTEATR